jgi:hypothetical protein
MCQSPEFAVTALQGIGWHKSRYGRTMMLNRGQDILAKAGQHGQRSSIGNIEWQCYHCELYGKCDPKASLLQEHPAQQDK